MLFKDKTILITGGAGSFGQKFTRYILDNDQPRKIIIYSRDEYKHSEMQHQFNDDRLRFFIGDVRDKERLILAMGDVDYVIHAAALKQVPNCEYSPLEAIKTNILGTANVVEAAVKTDVKKAILLSTDKAVNPINHYGATKLAAEKLFIAANYYKPIFSVVRYGNIMGSRGSVLPFFQGLIESGYDKLPITDLNMSRFWFTFDLAIKLVLNALKELPGLIFVGIAPSFHITDLAEAFKKEIKVIGIRSGEKLHETLLNKYESKHACLSGDCFIILPEYIFNRELDYSKYKNTGASMSISLTDSKYGSNANNNWLSVKEIQKLIKETI